MKSKSLFLLFAAACSSSIHANAPSNPNADAASLSVANAKKPTCTAAEPTNVAIALPADEAPHNQATEWWYYTGHLLAENGGNYGFELVFFQEEVAAGQFATVSHFAVTDVDNQAFYSQEAGPAAPYTASTDGFDLSLGNWSLSGSDGRDHLVAQTDGGVGIDFTTRDLKRVVYEFGDGHVVYPDGTMNFYYSRPLESIKGTLTIGGQTLQAEGTAWFDHQWGALPPEGWTWYGIQLDNGEQIMAYQVREPNSGAVIAQGGTFVDKKCGQTTLSDVSVGSSGDWLSPHSGEHYPTDYTLSIPSQNISLDLSPFLQDQELYTTAPIYSEMDSDVTGSENGCDVHGVAYVEYVNASN